VKTPVSKFAFQVHNLQRYSTVLESAKRNAEKMRKETNDADAEMDGDGSVVGLCTLESS
jgi:hypothetical protein